MQTLLVTNVVKVRSGAVRAEPQGHRGLSSVPPNRLGIPCEDADDAPQERVHLKSCSRSRRGRNRSNVHAREGRKHRPPGSLLRKPCRCTRTGQSPWCVVHRLERWVDALDFKPGKRMREIRPMFSHFFSLCPRCVSTCFPFFHLSIVFSLCYTFVRFCFHIFPLFWTCFDFLSFNFSIPNLLHFRVFVKKFNFFLFPCREGNLGANAAPNPRR